MSDDYTECNTCNKNLTIQLSYSSNSVPSKVSDTEPGDADGSYNENKIEKLDLFFYEGDVLKWKALSTDIEYNVSTNIAIIPIRDDIKALFDQNSSVTYDVYVVANSTSDFSAIVEGATNLTDLKNLVFETPDFISKGGSEPQTSFVMDGKLSKIINLNDPNLGEVKLARAASKIRLRVVEINVPDYTVDGNITAKLINLINKSALLNGGTATIEETDLKNSTAQNLSKENPEGSGVITTQAPFYSYSYDWSGEDPVWSNTPEFATYLDLVIPLKGQNGITNHYHYKVPITPQGLTGEQAQYMNNLKRNFIYDIGATIKMLGSIEEDPVEVSANYTIIDWQTQEVVVDVVAAHYLVVSEHNIVMPNINSYSITFNSSVANVTLVPNSLKATYTYVNYSTGQPVTTNVASNQMPTVTVQPNVASGNITIQSPIPTNYIPKDIEFKITNGVTGMVQTIVIRQLSATYFTTIKGKKSFMPGEGWRNSLPSGNTNPYMYAITTLAPEGDIIWGFPPVDNQGQTVNNYEVSRMVSPKFEMASQFGASQPKNYTAGQQQCRGYIEVYENENGNEVEKTGWRLPTAAEIAYIDKLQQTVPSGYVMKGRWYWSSWSQLPTQSVTGNLFPGYSFQNAYGAYRMGKGIYDTVSEFYNHYSGGATYNNAHVRCIRDIKD